MTKTSISLKSVCSIIRQQASDEGSIRTKANFQIGSGITHSSAAQTYSPVKKQNSCGFQAWKRTERESQL